MVLSMNNSSIRDRQLCAILSTTHTVAQVVRIANQRSYKDHGFETYHGKNFFPRWYYHKFNELGHYHDMKKGKVGRKKK